MSIRIVLVDPNHPGNIGAVARAMKNMGLDELHLVRPKFFPNADATARASGADDVLAAARVHEDFEDAIADCGLVVGTSARQRHLPWDLVEPRECARADRRRQRAIGRRRHRVRLRAHRADERRARALQSAGDDSDRPALQLAESRDGGAGGRLRDLARARARARRRSPPREVPLASAAEMARLYEHLEQVLEEIDFRDRTGGGHLMARIRRLFNRAQLDQNEVNILRGILTAVQARRRPARGAATTRRTSRSDAVTQFSYSAQQ